MEEACCIPTTKGNDNAHDKYKRDVNDSLRVIKSTGFITKLAKKNLLKPQIFSM